MPLARQKSSCNWCVRRAVPRDLQLILGKNGKRKYEIWKSTGTADKQAALKRSRMIEAQIDDVFERARAQKNPRDVNDVSDEDLVRMSREIYAEDVAKYADELLKDPEGLSEGIWWIIDDIGDAAKGNWYAPMRERIEKRIKDAGFTLSAGRGYIRAMQLVARAELAALNKVWAEAEGQFGYEPDDKLVSAPLAGPRSVGQLSVKDLVSRFEVDPGRSHITEKSRRQYDTVMAILLEIVGPATPAGQVTREDCRLVREKLIERGLATTTINNYLVGLSGLFEYAIREDIVDKNPARGLSIKTGLHGRDLRQPYSDSQLRRIFTSTAWRSCRATMPSLYWCPLISVYMGLRLTECGQLLRDDIKQIDDIWTITIEPSETKRVKSRAGQRIVPVHPKIIDLGFIEFWKGVNTERLFNDVRLNEERGADALGKRWRRLVRKLNADEPRTSFHSLRHRFTDACRTAKVPEGVMRQAGGWASGGGASGLYGSGYDVQTLANELACIQPVPEGVL